MDLLSALGSIRAPDGVLHEQVNKSANKETMRVSVTLIIASTSFRKKQDLGAILIVWIQSVLNPITWIHDIILVA